MLVTATIKEQEDIRSSNASHTRLIIETTVENGKVKRTNLYGQNLISNNLRVVILYNEEELVAMAGLLNRIIDRLPDAKEVSRYKVDG